MRVLGLIPARGGSKGVPRKNIRLACGKPLLQYTVEAALGSTRLTETILSTEDEEIADIGHRCGIRVPFVRPTQLAGDDTPMIDVVLNALEWMKGNNEVYDALCLLQPTNPLRQSSDIDGAIDLLECSGAESVISFVDVGEKHPARMKYIDQNAVVIDPPFGEQCEGQRRQDLPKLFLREGSIYLTRMSVLQEQRSFKGRDCRAWIIPPERACNVDTPFDLFIAEQLLKHGHGEQS